MIQDAFDVIKHEELRVVGASAEAFGVTVAFRLLRSGSVTVVVPAFIQHLTRDINGSHFAGIFVLSLRMS